MIATASSSNGQMHPEEENVGVGKIAQAITGRDYLSYSQVSMYQSCKLKFWFTYVAQAPAELVSGAMVLGSALHGVLEDHFQSFLAAEEPRTLDQKMEVFRTRWAEEVGNLPVQFPKDEDAGTLEATARRMLEQFLQSPYATPKGLILALEEPIRFQLSPVIPDLLAKVDLIEQVGDTLVITDFKTARSLWSQDTAEEHANQLVLYGKAAEPMARELGLQVKLQFVVLTKAKTPKIEAYTVSSDADRVRRSQVIIERVFQDMQAGVVYPNPSVMNCSTCPYQSQCKQWHITPAPQFS